MSCDFVLHGITTCDTVRKARRWLDRHEIAYRFHDLRKDGVAKDDLMRWAACVGWEKVLNRSGTTFRKLSDEEKQVTTSHEACDLMLAHPTVIKRPVLVTPDTVILGFRPEIYESFFLR